MSSSSYNQSSSYSTSASSPPGYPGYFNNQDIKSNVPETTNIKMDLISNYQPIETPDLEKLANGFIGKPCTDF